MFKYFLYLDFPMPLISSYCVPNFVTVQAMREKNWELAVQLRGKSFQRNLETYRMLTRYLSCLPDQFIVYLPTLVRYFYTIVLHV